MSHKRQLLDDARGPVFIELEANALNFDVVMERRNGILVDLSTPGGQDSPEARLIDTARLEQDRGGFKLVIDVPDSVTIINSSRGSIRQSFSNIVSGNAFVGMQFGYGNVQYNNFGSSGGGRSRGLVLEHGIDVVVYLPQDSSVFVERGNNLNITGRAGSIETDISGGSVRFDEAERVKIRTQGGSVKGQFVASGATVRSTGGNIKLGVTRGQVDLETSGGNVHIDEAYWSGSMRTSGGNVTLGSFYGDQMTMRTSGGDIRHPQHPGISARTSGGRVNGKSRW